MILFFFPVDNPQGLTSHSFDNVDFTNEEERNKVLDTLARMDGSRSYDTTQNTYQSRTPCLCDFVDDFNNEEFDQKPFWVVALPISEEELHEYIFKTSVS